MNRAAENALAVEDGLAAVAEWEAEHGAFSAEDESVIGILANQLAMAIVSLREGRPAAP